MTVQYQKLKFNDQTFDLNMITRLVWGVVGAFESFYFKAHWGGFSEHKGGRGACRKFSWQIVEDTCQFFVNHLLPLKDTKI